MRLSGQKTSRCLHLPTRILEVYIEALKRFSHVFIADGLNNNTLLSQGYAFETALAVRMVGSTYIPRSEKQ